MRAYSLFAQQNMMPEYGFNWRKDQMNEEGVNEVIKK